MIWTLLCISLIGGSWGLGCEERPCDQICIDTIDSYFCQCYTNWVLQDDLTTCIHERDDSFANIYLGCFTESTASKLDVEHYVWNRVATQDATVENCVHDCRTRSFAFAALQNGGECYCTNNYERLYGESSNCNMPCSGEGHQVCGGVEANSVYLVTQDKRYMGCYNEDTEDPDLPDIQWEASKPASPQECNMACSEGGYAFAGVMDGGRCSCGMDFGKHGVAAPNLCNVTCRHGWQEMNCGGENTNAIYRIVRAEDNSFSSDSPQMRASVPARILTEFPHTNGFLADRFVMYASDVVQAPYEDYDCYTGSCYETCGEIYRPEGIDANKQDVIIRQFHVKLSEIPNFITTECQRIFVFAQTLVIDQTTAFQQSMYLRARQIIINYEEDPEIIFDHNGANLQYDIEEAVTKGPESDLAFQKISTSCARILLDGDNDLDKRLGWAILDDIARDYSYGIEQKTYQDAVRNIKYVYTGLDMYGVNFAPYFTRSAFERQLENYFDKMSVYRDEYELMMDDITDCNNFVERGGNMLAIWASTIVLEAEVICEASRDALTISDQAYRATYREFNESRYELVDSIHLFIDGIIDTIKGLLLKGLLALVRSILKMAMGAPPTEAAEAAELMVEADPGLESTMSGFPYAAENIAYSIEDQEAFLQANTQMMTGLYTDDGLFEWGRFDGVTGIVSTLYVVIEEWQNIATIIDVTMQRPIIRDIHGALEFRMAFIDFCRWGEALTRGTIEHGENFRQAIVAQALYINKKLMQTRYQMYLNQVDRECTQLERAASKWAEQNYDIVMDLNHALITFCQAYFFESFDPCPASAMPDFSANLDQMLLRLLSAINVLDGYGRSSKAIIDINITDDQTTSNCSDVKLCPVNIFKDTRILQYTINPDDRAFTDLDLFLIEEIQIVFHGAFSTIPPEEDIYKQSLSVFIESTGPIQNQKGNQLETFLTRAMSGKRFKYNLNSGVIEQRCNLYQEEGSNIQRMTPFTTWFISMTDDPNMDHIDVSQVDRVTMTLIGSYQQ